MSVGGCYRRLAPSGVIGYALNGTLDALLGITCSRGKTGTNTSHRPQTWANSLQCVKPLFHLKRMRVIWIIPNPFWMYGMYAARNGSSMISAPRVDHLLRILSYTWVVSVTVISTMMWTFAGDWVIIFCTIQSANCQTQIQNHTRRAFILWEEPNTGGFMVWAEGRLKRVN